MLPRFLVKLTALRTPLWLSLSPKVALDPSSYLVPMLYLRDQQFPHCYLGRWWESQAARLACPPSNADRPVGHQGTFYPSPTSHRGTSPRGSAQIWHHVARFCGLGAPQSIAPRTTSSRFVKERLWIPRELVSTFLFPVALVASKGAQIQNPPPSRYA